MATPIPVGIRSRATGAGSLAFWVSFYVFIAVSRVTDFVPGARALPLAKVAFAVALLLAFSRRKELSDFRLWASPISKFGMLLLIVAIFTALWSIWPGKSVKVVLDVILIQIAAFFLVVKAAKSWETLRLLVFAFIASGAVLACVATLSYGGGRAEVESSYDTNDLAYVLVTIVPITIAYAGTQTGLTRLFYLGVAGVQLIAALLTQSRGGFIGLAFITVLMAFRPLTRKAQIRAANGGSSGAFTRIIIIATLGGLLWTVLPAETRERLSTLTSLEEDYNTDEANETGRVRVWKRNLAAVPGHPHGYGVGAFSAVDGTTGGRYYSAHNALVQVTVECGILGIFLYLAMQYQAFKGMARARRAALAVEPGSDKALMLQGFTIALVGNFVCAFFLSQAYSNLLWMMMATIAALIYLVESSTPATQGAETPAAKSRRPAPMARRVAR